MNVVNQSNISIIMRNLLSKLTAVFSAGLLTMSCSSTDDATENESGNLVNGNTMSVIFENSDFSGFATVTYTDGTVIEAEFKNGVCKIPNSDSEKTIATLKPEDQDEILIGRKEGSPIILNYHNNVLSHRAAVGGIIPIGTYAEFQLINNTAETLSRNYKMEATLDFMNVIWKPIGEISHNEATNTIEGGFTGNFDGSNHEIHNIKVEALNYGGLFAVVRATSDDGYIKNIIIKSGSIKLTNITGGYAGSIAALNHHFDTTVLYGNHTISNCINYATVDGVASTPNYLGNAVGGIIASSSGKIVNCKNYGSVKNAQTVGGIAAHAYIVENCHNYSDLNPTHRSVLHIGGIAAEARIIKSCSNSGNLSYVGINNPDQSGVSIGGLAARGSEFYNSYNKGKISLTNRKGLTGGIVGHLLGSFPMTIKGCFNTGDVTAINVVGGIAGIAHSTGQDDPLVIEHCYNTGNIRNIPLGTGLKALGGIIGGVSNESASLIDITIKNCYNTGGLTTVNNSGYSIHAGGIIGRAYFNGVNSSLITSNYWKDVSGDNAEYGVGEYIPPLGGEPSNIGCSIFSATSWPTAAQGWNIGNGAENAYWKSIGNWNGGSPDYPRLWFE